MILVTESLDILSLNCDESQIITNNSVPKCEKTNACLHTVNGMNRGLQKQPFSVLIALANPICQIASSRNGCSEPYLVFLCSLSLFFIHSWRECDIFQFLKPLRTALVMTLMSLGSGSLARVKQNY